MKKNILITGGLGFIGSHTSIELINAGYNVIIADNLSNSNINVLERIKRISGKNFTFFNVDVCNSSKLDNIFKKINIESVIHFAALKSISESISNPIKYYNNNIGNTLSLLKSMERANVKNLAFSSSATVYGYTELNPIIETSELNTSNPYGCSKHICENILNDLQSVDSSWKVAILRYFNPIGAHISGLLGEHTGSTPTNLMPYITQVALGKRTHLNIYGNDYATPDGTGIRDYIHVVDLAKGHLAALNYLHDNKKSITVNLGRGQGISVKELVDTFARVNKVKIPYKYTARRPGDVAICYANTTIANNLLKWKAQLGIEEMCQDSWRWQIKNPNGY